MQRRYCQGQRLAGVITRHKISSSVEQGKVTLAALDGKWDMIKQEPVQRHDASTNESSTGYIINPVKDLLNFEEIMI